MKGLLLGRTDNIFFVLWPSQTTGQAVSETASHESQFSQQPLTQCVSYLYLGHQTTNFPFRQGFSVATCLMEVA